MLEDENFNNVATRMQKGQGSKVLSEFFKQKNSLSGDLLPTEVCSLPVLA